MARKLNTATLNGRARFLAHEWMRPGNVRSRSHADRFIGGQEFVMQELFNTTFKDEFEFMMAAIQATLGKEPLKEFSAACAQRLKPRGDDVFKQLLRDKLAVDADGKHIDGVRGTTILGARPIGRHLIEVEHPYSVRTRRMLGLPKTHPARRIVQEWVPHYWNIYAGEEEERERGSAAVDPLPPPMMFAALNTRIANAGAITALDAFNDLFDGGTSNAVVTGRSGSQPAGPDTTATGTLLHTNAMSDPAMNGATDDNPGATAAADTISDDTSADASDTVGYCRVSSTNDGTSPLVDYLDGEAGASGADFNYNTPDIVAGGTVTMTLTINLPES